MRPMSRYQQAAMACGLGWKAPLGRRVHMIKLTQAREITPYPWVHPDNDDRH
jgi:hypothetical protein